MPIAVFTKLEGAGRSPAPEGAQEIQEVQEVQERPCGARKPYDGPQAGRPPKCWDVATCGDCAFFEAETSTCVGQSVDAKDSAACCFLWEPRRAEP